MSKHKLKIKAGTSAFLWATVPLFVGLLLGVFSTGTIFNNAPVTDLLVTKGTYINQSDIDSQINKNTDDSFLQRLNLSKLALQFGIKKTQQASTLETYANFIAPPEAKYITIDKNIEPKVSASAYIIGDLATGEIIASSNENGVFPIASVTKLMTALTSLENLDQNSKTTVSKNAWNTYGSRGNLRVGEEIEISDLLYPLLLVSSNDASEVLAEALERETFMQTMNSRAKSLGMANTSYEDASGLSENNISTAEDLFKLAVHLHNNFDIVFDVTKLSEFTLGNRSWKNANQFTKRTDYRGGKTGYTNAALRTGVFAFDVPFENFENRTLGVVVLRSSNRSADVQKLIDYAQSNTRYEYETQLTTSDVKKTVKMSFLGDIMMDRGVKSSIKKNFNGDYGEAFKNLTELNDANIVFANIEGPISDKGRDVGGKYSFRMEPEVLDALDEASVNVVSFANNHVGDWSKEAFEDTLNRFDAHNITYVGAGKNKIEASTVKILKYNGVKVGFLGFSDVGPSWMEATSTKPGILLASDTDREKYIKEAKKKVDFLAVSYHWGDEYVEHNSRQKELAYSSVDAGADIIIGHHPHVVQEIETYKDATIVYSLGNAIFDQHFSKETMEGLLFNTLVSKDGIIDTQEKYFNLSGKYIPQTPTANEPLKTIFEPEVLGAFKEGEVKSITLGWVGDIIPGFDKYDLLPNSKKLFEELKEFTQKPDIMIGNLEGVITKEKDSKCKMFSTNCFAFKNTEVFAKNLAQAGFDILNISNNHSFDYKEKGFEETLKNLSKEHLYSVGEKNKVTYMEKDGVHVGFVSFSSSPNLNQISNLSNIRRLVSEAESNADVVAVILHAGAEGPSSKRTPDTTEYYLGENRGNVREVAYTAIDAGADVVFGSGPHVVRGMEFYEDKLIVYSTGNFGGYRALSVNKTSEDAFGVQVELNTKGEFIDAEIESFKIAPNGIPYIEENHMLDQELNSLSRSDFPLSYALVSSAGKILNKPNAGLVNGIYLENNPCPSSNHNPLDLFNANRANAISGSYTPPRLVPLQKPINTRGRTICMKDEAAEAFTKMVEVAKSDGQTIIPTSGHRSHSIQEILYENYLKRNSRLEKYIAVAEPGHSEHHLGTTVDLTSPNINYGSASSGFESTSEFTWMTENAHKFGFVMSYPKGKEDVTGYRYESWHWRYMGQELATEIKSSGLTTIEYLDNIGG